MALLELSPSARALERVREGRPPGPADAEALLRTPSSELSLLLDAASELRDRGRGRRITFSAKVFVPLTTLCRDYCGYCTFRKDPGEPGAFTLTPEQVLALVKAGERLGAKEALFSLGDKPEALFPEHREFLRRMGHRTTLDYLRAVSALVLKETGLLPHANPGLMGERDLKTLREVNVSMGIMLESTSTRLLAAGAAHDRAPDKIPARRLKTIALAGQLAIPFTTGHPDRHRRDARRADRVAPRDPRAPRAVRAHPGSHHPELPGEDVDSDASDGRSLAPRIC